MRPYIVTPIVVLALTLAAGCEKARPTAKSALPTTAVTPAPTATHLPPTATLPPTPPLTPTPAPIEWIKDVPYLDGGNVKQKLDIYLPGGQDGPLPTLLMIHGGGGDKLDIAYLARYFAQRGYAAVSINHRDMPYNIYPTAVQDAFCALAWTHANASAYGFDPGRIVALGHSSGGTLAAMLGTVDDPSLYMTDCPYPLPEVNRVRGVVSFTGIFDYARAANHSDGLRSYIVDYLGAEPDQAPETWAVASPITWVDGSEPPFLLIHGAKDTNIDPTESVNFADALKKAGVEADLLLIPNADHTIITTSEDAFTAVEAALSKWLAAP